ncbi:LysR family transcriptional regulator [Emcibacter sp.]|uniref:LysR family transcriptional regulator n=1 Tax=Emcibacter sp. TaxID=1979954 RepID=UPI002AA89F24|nr:LysR family transcriptional regulator [Emcibacter sp.]
MHFKGLDLNLIVILDALLDEQSVTRAAERVHVSQPAVSAALAKLRQHTGDEILEKVGREFVLTPRAQAMIKPVKELLIQIESTILSGAEFDPTLTERTYKIAMSSYSAEVLMAGLVEKITKSYPGISCIIEEISSETLSRVETGSIDCAITFQQTKLINPSSSIEEFSYTHVFSDEWVLVAASNNDHVTENMTYEEFCALPYIETRLARILSSFVESTLDHQSCRPRPNLSVPSFELAITCVMNSDCVAVVPALLVDDHLRQFVKTIKPPFEIPAIGEFLVWHSRSDADPGHIWFRELILGVARESQLQIRPRYS